MPDVVAHRLSRQMELVCYLLGRAAPFEQREHLGLARRQVKLGMGDRLLRDVGDLSEDTDHVLAVEDRYGAHLHRHPTPLSIDQDDPSVGDRFVADDLSREYLPG